jgi:hypothetical protein
MIVATVVVAAAAAVMATLMAHLMISNEFTVFR